MQSHKFLMHQLPWLVVVLLAGSAPLGAQKKEIIQLQRDMAILQEQVRQGERQMGERLAVLENLLNQNLEASSKLNAAIAVIERSIAKQGDEVIAPVASIRARVDTLGSQFDGLRDAVEEVSVRMRKVQQEVEDIKTQLTTLPPPSLEGDGEEGASPAATSSSAQTLFESALTDYQRGNYDLSGAQFSDYLRYYPSGARAAEAEYHLGAISYSQQQFHDAIQHFDLVLERYPVSTISSEALYKKGMALVGLSKNDEAAAEFRALLDQFPNSNVAPNAQAQLEMLQPGSAVGPAESRL